MRVWLSQEYGELMQINRRWYEVEPVEQGKFNF